MAPSRLPTLLRFVLRQPREWTVMRTAHLSAGGGWSAHSFARRIAGDECPERFLACQVSHRTVNLRLSLLRDDDDDGKASTAFG